MLRLLLFLLILALPLCAADLRVGIIGTDTSHVTAFTKILNDPTDAEYVAGARVVAAWKGGSPDLESSASRVEKYAEELRTNWKVEIVPQIRDMCSKVDAILLESVDGRVHLKQAREAAACGKPVFIDKPLADTLEGAREIARVMKQANVTWFSSSSLRYTDFLAKMKSENIQGAATWGPGPFDPTHHLDLSWYAIHPIEMLYTLMGTGCEEVTRISGKDADLVIGKWKGGRIGTVRALRPYGEYGAVVYRAKDFIQGPPESHFSYRPLLVEVVKFFQTGKAPVPNEETLELFAFMDAAQRSKEAGGKPTPLR